MTLLVDLPKGPKIGLETGIGDRTPGKATSCRVDVDHLWENTLPGVAASQDQLRSLEVRLGHALDPQHREFLLHANGWRAFRQHVDVFGIDDFEGGPRAVRTAGLIESIEPLDTLCGFGKRDS